MKARRLALMGSALAAAVLLALPVTALASTGDGHAVSQGNSISKGKYCITVIAKIHPPQPAAKVVSQTCSDEHAPNSSLPKGVVVPASETPLVTFYQDEDYGGASNTIDGKNGACDAEGYGLEDLSYENTWVVDGISSYETHSNCWAQKYWSHTKGWSPSTTPCKTFTNTWQVRFVGGACNDNLISMFLWDQR